MAEQAKQSAPTPWWQKVADALGLTSDSESSEGELRELRDQVVLLSEDRDRHAQEAWKCLASLGELRGVNESLAAENVELMTRLVVAEAELTAIKELL